MTEISKIIPENLDPDKQYVVRIRSVNGLGNASDWSEGLYIDTGTLKTSENLVQQGTSDFSILNDQGQIVFGAYSVQKDRLNLVINPSFEIDSVGWSARLNTSLVRSGAKAFFGTYGAKLTPIVSGVTDIGITSNSGYRIDVNEAEVYSTACFVYRYYDSNKHSGVSAATSKFILSVTFYDVSGEELTSPSPSSSINVNNNEWVRLKFENITAPINAVKMSVNVDYDETQTTTMTVDEYFSLDGVLVEQGENVGSYFDGSVLLNTTSWTGTPHASTSIFNNTSSSTLNIQGTIIAESGYIGTVQDGWVITDSRIFSANGNITLDSVNEKIFIGAGNYGATDTSLYADATGKFSLKDALTFDGTTLTVGGYTKTVDLISGITTFSQPTEPTAVSEGDLWIDTDDLNKVYRWNSSAWILTILDAASDIVTNATTITGGNVTTGNLKSANFAPATPDDGSAFSTTGTNIDLDAGTLTSKTFRINSSGDAFFKGDVTGSSGTFSGSITGATGTFTGSITGATGSIGGWTIGGSSLSAGSTVLYSSGTIFCGTIYTAASPANRIIMGSDIGSGEELRFYYGASNVVSLRNNGTALRISGYTGGVTDFGNGYVKFISQYITVSGASTFSSTLTVDSTLYAVGGIVASNTVRPVTSGAANLGSNSYPWNNIYSVNPLVVTSDSRLKTNIRNSDLGLNFVKNLRPVSYRWIKKESGTRLNYGFIAQEVRATLDSLGVKEFGGWNISNKNDPDSLQSLSYSQFIPPIVKAIQELSAKVNDLEQKLAMFENQ